MSRSAKWGSSVLLALLLGLVLAGTAQAERALLSSGPINKEDAPGGQVEGACGLVVSAGAFYVSDYYHHSVAFPAPGGGLARIPAGTPPQGPCGLALSSTGALYANLWHQSVVRLKPSFLSFDTNDSTGVAVDAEGNVYANDRTYVAVYEPSGVEVMKVGLGTLNDAYGLAVFNGRVYVADAATETIKVYEPATDIDNPVLTITGSGTPQQGFNSLVDAALAIDPTNGHLLVVDNLQPGYEHPEAVIDEFDSSGLFLGQLAEEVINGGPSGIAVDSAGKLYVTSGNSENSELFSFGPYTASGPTGAPASEGGEGSPFSAAGRVGPAAQSGTGAPKREEATATTSETIRRGHFQVAVDGQLAPKALPRQGSAPVRFSLATRISSTNGSVPPQLQQIKIEINRYGRIDTTGLPLCELEQIQPATTKAALAACRESLIGEGRFSAKVLITEQSPFPSNGKVYAFNGRWKGKPAILAHVYGTEPVPISETIPFVIGRAKGNTYGTVLSASLPQVTSKWGYVTGISMDLGRHFSYRGKSHSYLSAGCPAPKGFPGATFSLARTSLRFEGGRKLSSVLSRSCRVR